MITVLIKAIFSKKNLINKKSRNENIKRINSNNKMNSKCYINPPGEVIDGLKSIEINILKCN